LEFKDKERNQKVVASANLDPILDDEFEEKRLKTDENLVEKDSYIASIVFLLLNLSYAYLELRHYKEALECLNECETLAEDKVADVFFRRSQARTYNKISNDEDLELARKDILKAKDLKSDIKIYSEHLEILDSIIEKRKQSEIEKISSNE
jgi:tetratricopeptide (TPR) repeat protein